MTQLIEFTPPSDFTVPEGTQPGQDFDVVSTYRLKPSGKVCLVMIGNAQMPGYDKKDDQRPQYGDYAKSMQEPMDDGAGGSGGGY